MRDTIADADTCVPMPANRYRRFVRHVAMDSLALADNDIRFVRDITMDALALMDAHG
jgi:hypothetical protein